MEVYAENSCGCDCELQEGKNRLPPAWGDPVSGAHSPYHMLTCPTSASFFPTHRRWFCGQSSRPRGPGGGMACGCEARGTYCRCSRGLEGRVEATFQASPGQRSNLNLGQGGSTHSTTWVSQVGRHLPAGTCFQLPKSIR